MENIIQLKEILLDYMNYIAKADDLIFIDNLDSYTIYYWTADSGQKSAICKKQHIIMHYYNQLGNYKNTYKAV